MEILKLEENLKILQEGLLQVVDYKYKQKMKQKLELLDKYEYQIEDFGLEEPEFSLDVQSYSEMEQLRLKNDIIKHVKLLQILIYKVNCPISKVVDEI